MQAYHNSANPAYRFPLGALKTCDEVYLGLRIVGEDVKSVYLHFYADGYEQNIEMNRNGNLWFVNMTVPERAAAYFYYFRINTAYQTQYYCGDYKNHCGEGTVCSTPAGAFQLTVYERDFETPVFLHKAVMYQIFPDRFARGDENSILRGKNYHESLGRKVYIHEDVKDEVEYLPHGGDEYYTPDDFFGGDIAGITASLDYLESLGVNVIYLNPVFESCSNHRYDTADYLKLDPFLGTEEDFDNFIAETRKRGIRVILDGVFSHTGADSRYFDKYSRYGSDGAYQKKDSEFFSWYSFSNYPHEYKSWWGFKSLPEVNELDKEWQDFVITGENSVMAYWLKKGISGFRLDVADELPDEVIELMRKTVKKYGGALIGEVWEDPTTKLSYGVHRTYALGKGLDSVMNYPLRNAIVDFVQYRMSAGEFADFLMSQWQNYPKPMYYSLMNLLSSHDIARIRTALTTTPDASHMPRQRQAHYVTTPSVLEHATDLNKLAAALIFCLPGMPSIYYGDETGMQGLTDPFNRRFFNCEDEKLTEFYRTISSIRRRERTLRFGDVSFRAIDKDIFVLVRYLDGDTIVFIANRSNNYRRAVFDILGTSECMTNEDKRAISEKKHKCAVSLLNKKSFSVESALINIELLPISFDILKLS